ncbi:unnamed protein product [Brachionus calyciflorus]|uniref:DDHD domain-containing protein n=1 Tax=Brachionus calyciflorus TaxID=104777 RepID=A0A813W3S1_9BILA|nr:unnamed protein product [Brachionus calyciflorus]
MDEDKPKKMHPLEINPFEEEEDSYEFKYTRTYSLNRSIDEVIEKKADNRKSEHFENLIIPKRRPDKRIAPKIPPKNDENKSINFYIDIDQVRWFYKGDKDSYNGTGLNTPNTNMSTTSLPTVQSSSNLLTPDQSSQNLTENDINNNSNNNNNSCPSNINITSKKWHMFSKIDSYNLEIEYRDMMSKKHLNIHTESNLVQVLNDLYEVNLETKKCYPIYWKVSKTMTVMRCIWYTDNNEPFEERVGEIIEKKHIELFKEQLSNENDNSVNNDYQARASSPESIDESTSNKTNKNETKPVELVGSLQFSDGVINWYSKDEVFWEKTKLNMINLFTSFKQLANFKNKYSGVKIRRGVKEKHRESDHDEKPQEITHLIFVIHGIAQKLYENSVIKNCEDLRKECEKKKKEFFPHVKDERFVFVPVDWRSSLTLDDGIVESITPKSIQTIRDKLNSSALDIMYYTSPLFRAEIMTSLTSEMNRLYNLFCQKNPNFKKNHNKVSIVAHSLGTVIVYDIITSNNSYTQFTNNYGEDLNQEKLVFNHFSNNDEGLLDEYLQCKKKMQDIEKSLIKSNSNTGLLAFKTENFFLLGSPLAVFLALRGVRPAGLGSQDHILPKHICKRLFNIFHPSDPIAYRLEPLVLKHYATKSPIEILKSSDLNSLKVSYKELNERRSALNIDLKSVLSKASSGKKKDKIDPKSAELNQLKDEPKLTASNSDNRIDQVELERALDYQLIESNFEIVATLRAHTCYWKSADTALFIMQKLCSDNDDDDLIARNSAID